MQKMTIGWTEKSWNPVHGCSMVSAGCKHCYAAELSLKFGLTDLPWTVANEFENVTPKMDKFHEPYTIKEPSRIFTNSMSDLFHSVIPDVYRAAIFCVMLDTPQHTYQILTKRTQLIAEWETQRFFNALESDEFSILKASIPDKRVKAAMSKQWTSPWAEHIWLGATVEDQRSVYRIAHLQDSGAPVRFISAEPLLSAWGEVDLSGIQQVIVGGESGKHMQAKTADSNPRWLQMSWARHIRDLCAEQDVAFFFKQDSGNKPGLRPYLVEADGSRWRYHQFPFDHSMPLEVDADGQLMWVDAKPSRSEAIPQ